jgi:hypothetical protein
MDFWRGVIDCVRARDVQAVGALDLGGLDMGLPEEQHSGSM